MSLIEMSRRKRKCVRGPVHYEHMALLCQSTIVQGFHTGVGKITFNKDARGLYQVKESSYVSGKPEGSIMQKRTNGYLDTVITKTEITGVEHSQDFLASSLPE